MYTLTQNPDIVLLPTQNLSVRRGSRYWDEYEAWLADGNTPEPVPQPTLSAERAAMICTPAQMRLTLHRMDLLTQVQAIADADPEASIVWEYATAIERTSPLIDALGGPNGFTDTQIDDIFRAAMQV
jgi:hypothetical protein